MDQPAQSEAHRVVEITIDKAAPRNCSHATRRSRKMNSPKRRQHSLHNCGEANQRHKNLE